VAAHLQEHVGIFLEHALEEGDLGHRVFETLVDAAERGLAALTPDWRTMSSIAFGNGKLILQRRIEIGVEHERAVVELRRFRTIPPLAPARSTTSPNRPPWRPWLQSHRVCSHCTPATGFNICAYSQPHSLQFPALSSSGRANSPHRPIPQVERRS
jgi:hypothetical protein